MKKQTAVRRFVSAMLAIPMMLTVVTLTGCGADKPYDIHLQDYVKVGEYKGISYIDFKIRVTEEEIQEEVEKVLQKYSVQTERTEGPLEEGDYASIQYKLEVDGDKLNGSSSRDYTIHVGEETILEDIDKALLGKEAGETFEVQTTFPEDFELSSQMAGKEALFTITVKKIFDVTLPVLDDAFVSENLGFNTADDYLENLKAELYDQKQQDARFQAGEEIWTKVLESSEVLKYPEDEVKQKQDALTESFRIICEKYGTTLEEALDSILKTDETEFMENIRTSAESAVKEEMILYYIARENGLEMTLQEQQAYLDDVLAENGITAREFKEKYSTSIEEYAEESGILTSLLYERVFDFLVENGVPE